MKEVLNLDHLEIIPPIPSQPSVDLIVRQRQNYRGPIPIGMDSSVIDDLTTRPNDGPERPALRVTFDYQEPSVVILNRWRGHRTTLRTGTSG